MKRKSIITLALVASITSTAFADFSAPLPEFKTPKQLAEWRAEMEEKPKAKPTTTQDTAFYTGKPYLASSGDYAFKFRSYNPEIARWTSEDPSGFPDGANSYMYAPIIGSQVDPMGLWTVELVSASGRTDAPIEQFTTLSGAVTVEANQAVFTSGFNIFSLTTVGLFHGITTSEIHGSVGISPGGNEIKLDLSSPNNQTSSGLAVSAVGIGNIVYSDSNRTVSFNLTYGGSSSFGGLSVGSFGVSSTGSGFASGFETVTYTLVE
jgi:RHS repeat-associated protein